MVAEGQFHADLYYRLEVMTVRIPSLAERPEDIATMFRRYVDQAAEQSGVQPPEVTPQMIAGLILPRKTFYDKLARYGIRPEDFRS